MQRAQFYAGVAKDTLEQGGTSVHAVTGATPSSGWMVSTGDRETVTSVPRMSGRKVGDYIHRHKEALAEPDLYLGTWREGRGPSGDFTPRDSVYIETSANLPDAVTAHASMAATNQKAAWRVQPGVHVSDRRVSGSAAAGAKQEYTLDEMRRGIEVTEPRRDDQGDRIRAEVGLRRELNRTERTRRQPPR
jgi:hypothetical protein